MSTTLTISLIILVLVCIAAVISLTVYCIKFLIELTLLTKNLDETTSIVKKEIEPILGELKETMTNVNTFAQNANNQITTAKKIFATVLGFFSMFADKFKFLQGGFMKGFFSAFNLFRRK